MIRVLLIIGLLFVSQSSQEKDEIFNGNGCENDHLFVNEFKPQILKLKDDIKKIFDHVTVTEKGRTYDELSEFVDKFGSRFVGTDNLENAIDFMLKKLEKQGHDNVHGELVKVPKWIRGHEWAEMVEPRKKKMSILGLGYSIGTLKRTLEAEAIVVKSFDELDALGEKVKGKFVVYNFNFESYGAQAQYRGRGASQASKYGAVGAFIRSLTSFSLNTPHTGMQRYSPDVHKIPAVSITVEDAELFERIQKRGEKIVLRLYSENNLVGNGISRNTVSEVKGSTMPDDVVLVSGHLDSWDVGEGAMDDGGGAFISWRALSVIKKLNLHPKLTMRSVLWTGEEMGLLGAAAYAKNHSNESFSLAMESDIGTFEPIGITFSGKNLTSRCAVWSILQQFPSTFNGTRLRISNEGSDTTFFDSMGIPISSLDTDNKSYFDFHHTEADTMTVLDAGQLDRNTALWTAVSYAVASLDQTLPR